MAYEQDFLVLGSGIAGLSFALRAAQHGQVSLVTKKASTESATNYAQGGIAAAKGFNDRFDAGIVPLEAILEGLSLAALSRDGDLAVAVEGRADDFHEISDLSTRPELSGVLTSFVGQRSLDP